MQLKVQQPGVNIELQTKSSIKRISSEMSQSARFKINVTINKEGGRALTQIKKITSSLSKPSIINHFFKTPAVQYACIFQKSNV